MEFPSGLDGRGMPAVLEKLYPNYDLVKWGGHRHPITAFPAASAENCALEAPLGSLSGIEPFGSDFYSDDWHPDGAVELRREIDEAASAGRWNGPTYSVDRIRLEEGKVRLDASPGRYLQNMVTSDALDLELSAALHANPHGPIPMSAIPNRAWLMERVADPVVDGSHRSSALSLSVTVVAPDADGGYLVLLSPRSNEVRRHALFNHVAPSGVLQPPRGRDDLWRSWFSVEKNFLAEFTEELYPSSRQSGDPEAVHSNPHAERLFRLIGGGDASLWYTGVSVNLLMLRPEVCLTLFVRDPEWLSREVQTAGMVLSREFLGIHDAQQLPTGRRHLTCLSLDNDLNPDGEDAEQRPSALVPQAAASMALAMDTIRAAM